MSSNSRSSTPKLNTSKQPPPTRSNAPSPSPAPPTSTSTSTSTSTTPLPDLSTLLNLPVELTTCGDNSRTIKGILYTYDPTTSIVVISSPSSSSSSNNNNNNNDSSSSSSTTTSSTGNGFSMKRNYDLIKTSQITSISVITSSSVSSSSLLLFPSIDSPLPSGHSTSLTSINQRVNSSLLDLQKRKDNLGPLGKTTQESRKVYELLGKTLPVRWTENGEIVVMDELVVNPKENWSIKGGKGSKERIDRVGKVLEGIRAKVAANGGSQTPAIG